MGHQFYYYLHLQSPDYYFARHLMIFAWPLLAWLTILLSAGIEDRIISPLGLLPTKAVTSSGI
jgi:hypothetical protein